MSFLAHLRQHLRWSLLWSVLLLVSVTGLLYIMGENEWGKKLSGKIGSQSVGGWLGYTSYGETHNYRYGFSLLGGVGATIVYATLLLISVLFLTNFQFGEWLRHLWDRKMSAPPAENSPEEQTLERRARELQKQAKKLQEEVERTGLGADGQPVPEPTVRDLSVPQAKPARAKKPAEPVKEPAPPDEGVVIPAREVAAATTADVLGKAKPKSEDNGGRQNRNSGEKPAEPEGRTGGAHRRTARLPAACAEAQTGTQKTEAHHRRFHAAHRQLPVAVDGFSPALRT